MTGGVGFLRIAQNELFGEGIFSGGEGDFRLGAGGLRGGDPDGSVGKLGAEALEFEVLGLEDDEVFEIRVHKGSG